MSDPSIDSEKVFESLVNISDTGNPKNAELKIVSKLEIVDDIAQRDQKLEQNLALLAEAALLAKQGNEASFKDLASKSLEKKVAERVQQSDKSKLSRQEVEKLSDSLEKSFEAYKRETRGILLIFCFFFCFVFVCGFYAARFILNLSKC